MKKITSSTAKPFGLVKARLNSMKINMTIRSMSKSLNSNPNSKILTYEYKSQAYG